MHPNIKFVLLILCNLYVRKCSAEESYFLAVPEKLTFPLKFTAVESELCQREGRIFLQNLKNYSLWAYRMWDSSAKVPLGLTEGSQYQLGNYDECLKINHPIKAQYCLTTINIVIKLNSTRSDPFSLEEKPFSSLYENLAHLGDPNKIPRDHLFWGFCLPASCNVDDIIYELEEYLNQHLSSHIKEYELILNNDDCQHSTEHLHIDVQDYIFCISLICFLVFILICTCYDMQYIAEDTHSNIKNKKSVKIMRCFSIKQNWNDLISSDSSNEFLKIIYGIRFLLTCSLVMGHSMINTLNGSIFNFDYIEKTNRSLSYMSISRGELVVDFFFLLGGLLCTYNYLDQSSKRTVNPLRSLLLRYFRFIPVFCLVSLFYATIFYKLGSGPLWNRIIGSEKGYCEQNWWTNILLLNNYINVENMCILQGWYLAADFQLAILAVPLNMLVKKNNTLCWFIIAGILLVSIAIPFSLIYFEDKAPLFYAFNNFIKNIRHDDYFTSIYIPMHTRAATYIIGMILGHIYYKLKDSKLNFSVIPSIWMFIIPSIIATGCIIGGIYFYDPYIPYSALKSACYAAFSRPAFAISCAFILFPLSYGDMSMMTKPLRWKIFVPLGKLSFGVYMTHWAIQISRVGLQRTPVTISMYYWMSQTIFEIVFSHILAVFIFILIENPFNKLMKEIIPTNDNSSVPEVSCHQNNETKLALPSNETSCGSTERIIP